jgi:hypothetical protein
VCRPHRPEHRKGPHISTSTQPGPLTAERFEHLVQAHLDGLASDDEVALLAADEKAWADALRRLLADVEAKLERLRTTVTGPERELVLEDFDLERRGIRAALVELLGEDALGDDDDDQDEDEDGGQPDPEPSGPPQLQLSWARGRLIAWGGSGEGTETVEEVLARLREASSPGAVWTPRDAIALPDSSTAEAVEAPLRSVLGWLVALGASDAGGHRPSSTRRS